MGYIGAETIRQPQQRCHPAAIRTPAHPVWCGQQGFDGNMTMEMYGSDGLHASYEIYDASGRAYHTKPYIPQQLAISAHHLLAMKTSYRHGY